MEEKLVIRSKQSDGDIGRLKTKMFQPLGYIQNNDYECQAKLCAGINGFRQNAKT